MARPTLNLSMATDASDRDLTENGVTFRAKVIALNTVTTVKACRHTATQQLMMQFVLTQLAVSNKPTTNLTAEQH